MFVNPSRTMMKAVVLLAAGSVAAAAPVPLAFAAAPLVQQAVGTADGTVEPTTASLLADIHLPDGANRATGKGDLAKFNHALMEAARTNGGTIGSTEVLVWTGDAAKNVVVNVSALLKANGYMVAEVSSFDAEMGKITPLAAMRGSDDANRLVGMWIQTETGDALLIWGRFIPSATPAAKPAPKKPVSSVAPKAKPVVRKVLLSSPKHKPAASKSGGETAAQRQAKAMKAYQDYQYVKFMAPISGSMYRSSKW